MADTIGVGDWVEFPKHSKRTALVVDVNPDGYVTPHPSIVISWKEGRVVKESVVQTQYARKITVINGSGL